MNYATLTNEQKEFIEKEFEFMKDKTTIPHAAACIAHSYLEATKKRWSARTESNAFAAVFTFIGWQLKAFNQ